MAFTSNDLDSVDRAIAMGQLEVDYDGKKVKFRSMDELIKARNLIRDELALQQGTPRRRSSIAITNMNR
ncbi:phage head-tail joining protein [Paraburkholderia pallida]|uniref:GpW protein n=1 Tax=Paraburkholderia pallida TaxID=2547399 RepID=A0A4P7CTS2_9BURK|nr:hypothetical protein [Paraburkholderia pallida]QBQ98176.1 hypothetical protein E1956_13995 [Paraburkholderia pallida]